MRINKYIAHAGVASRRKAEELIKDASSPPSRTGEEAGSTATT